MNTSKRQELENKMKEVKITLIKLETEFGTTVENKKDFNISDLTDKEISNLYSNFSWGLKKGIITTNDRNENATLKWVA